MNIMNRSAAQFFQRLMQMSLIIVGLCWSHDSSSYRNKEKLNPTTIWCFPPNDSVVQLGTICTQFCFFFFNGLLQELFWWKNWASSADVSELAHILLSHNFELEKSPLGWDFWTSFWANIVFLFTLYVAPHNRLPVRLLLVSRQKKTKTKSWLNSIYS